VKKFRKLSKKLTSKFKNQDNSKPPKLIISLFLLILVASSIGLINDIANWKGIKPFGSLWTFIAQQQAEHDYADSMKGSNTQKLFAEDTYDRCEIMNPSYYKGSIKYWSGWTMYSGASKFGEGQANMKDWKELDSLDNSPCGSGQIDLLAYLLPRTPATIPLERQYCIVEDLGQGNIISVKWDLSQVVRGKVDGKDGFYLRDGQNNYRSFTYDKEYIYPFTEINDGFAKCSDGTHMSYSKYLEGKYKRCVNPGEKINIDLKIDRKKIDADGTLTDENCLDQINASTRYEINYASGDSYAPSGLPGEDTIYWADVGPEGGVPGEFIKWYYSRDSAGNALGYSGKIRLSNEGLAVEHRKADFTNEPQELKCQIRIPIADDLTFEESQRAYLMRDKSWLNCNFDSCIYSTPDKTSDVLRADFSRSSSDDGDDAPTISTGKNKAGSNMAPILPAHEDKMQILRDHAEEMGFSYILAMVITPDEGSIASAARFVDYMGEKDLIPIIRLCYTGSGCGFKSSQSLINFFTEVNKRVQYNFIAMLGPNEPGTAAEIYEFTSAADINQAYADVVRMATEAATALESMRVVNGGKMYLSPGAFNLTNPVNDDALEYLQTHNLDINKFDYLMGNAYVVNGKKPSEWYTSTGKGFNVKEYVDSHSTKFIFTEIGVYALDAGDDQNQMLKDDFVTLCSDANVSGMLFFRSFASLEYTGIIWDPHPKLLSDEVIKDIIGSCALDSSQNGKSDKSENANSTAYACGTESYAEDEDGFSGGSYFASSTCEITKDNTSDVIAKLGDSISADPRFYKSAVDKGSENGAGTDWVLGMGPGGQSNPAYKKFEELMATPDAYAALIVYGTNDCSGITTDAFEQRLIEIGKKLQDKKIIPVFLTIPGRRTTHKNDCVSGSSDNYNDVIKQVARENNWVFIDSRSAVPDSEIRDDDYHIDDDPLTNVADESGYRLLNAEIERVLSDLKSKCKDSNNSNTTETPSQNQNGNRLDTPSEAVLKVVCEGGIDIGADTKELVNGTYQTISRKRCFTKKVDTVEVKMPIKSFGSNSAFGSLTRSYTPICVEAASIVSGSSSSPLDPLNQYAGKLTTSSGSQAYAMPWLGSGINCSAELAKYNYLNFSQYAGLMDFPYAGSFFYETKLELAADVNKKIAKLVPKAYSMKEPGEAGDYLIPDERAFYFDTYSPANNELQEKISDKAHTVFGRFFREYNPFNTPSKYVRKTDTTSISGRDSCNSTKVITALSEEDYITGPEVKLGSTETDWGPDSDPKTESDACWLYAQRNNGGYGTGEVIGTETNNCRITDSIFRKTYPDGTYDFIYCSQAQAICNEASLKAGTCNVSEYYKLCFVYDYDKLKTDDEAIYHKTTDFAGIPVFNIPDIYDALHRSYLALQNELSVRNRKLVFRENIGWETIVSTKMRDAGRSVAGAPTYAYSQKFSSQCSTPTMISNSNPLAKLSSVKSEKQIFDWLGYLDIIQEWRAIYAASNTLPSEDLHKNPLFDKSRTDKLVYSKEAILIGNVANFAPSTDLLTCDQLEVCKEKTQEELKQFYMENEGLKEEDAKTLAFRTCPFDEKLGENVQLTCVTDSGYTADPEGDYCRGNNSSDGEVNPSVIKKLSSGGVYSVIDSNAKFFAEPASTSTKSITEFATSNGIGIAINTNMFSASGSTIYQTETPVEGKQQLGLVGGSGQLHYLRTNQESMEYAIVFHDGGLSDIEALKEFIKFDNGSIAVVDIRKYRYEDSTGNLFDDKEFDELEKAGVADIAISGLPLIVEDGIPLPDSVIEQYGTGFQDTDIRPRTIIGWKDNAEDIYFVVLDAANLRQSVDRAKNELNLDYALMLDGGGSSQMYSKDGFGSDFEGSSNLRENGTVYYPTNTESIRSTVFLGIKAEGSSSDDRDEEDCIEAKGVYVDKLAQVLCQRGYIIPDVCDKYYCIDDSGINDDDDQGSNPPECGTDTVMSCPIHDKPRYMSQDSEGCGYYGNCGFSHTESSIINQHPTDLNGGNPGSPDPDALVYSVTDGIVTGVYSPTEISPKYCGTPYYDGGFTVYVRGTDGNLYGYVHLEDIKVKEGETVNENSVLGKVFDGEFESGPYAAYDAMGGCAGRSNPHVHFFIVDEETSQRDPTNFSGNKINSTYCIAKACGFPTSNNPDKKDDSSTGTFASDPSNSDGSSDKGPLVPINISCIPRDDEIDTDFKTIFELIEAVAISTGAPKEALATTMSTEARTAFADSIGDAIKNDTAFMKGDPNQVVELIVRDEETDEILSEGVMQIRPSTFTSYISRYPQETLKCVKDIGMKETTLEQLDPKIVGHGICVAAIITNAHLADSESRGLDVDKFVDYIPTYGIESPGWDENNPVWLHFLQYVGGNTVYANQGWGRYLVYRMVGNWEKFKKGDLNITHLQNYLVTLGVF
jgi:exopolysaccharide biosynthesis protein